jgi:serine protease AprX
MATPVVSGAAALLLEQNPSLTPDQVKARLMKTAGKGFPEVSIATDTITGASYTSYYDIFTIGAGYLDVSAALSDTSQASGSAMSPTAAMDPQTGEIFLVQDGSTVWGSTPVWSLTQIWASSAVWGSSAVSGDSVVWGSAAIGTGPDGLLGEAMTVVGER